MSRIPQEVALGGYPMIPLDSHDNRSHVWIFVEKTPSSDTAASMTVVPAPGCGTSTGITGMTSGDVGEAGTDLASVWTCGRFFLNQSFVKNRDIGTRFGKNIPKYPDP